jgi:Autoinducer binding domain
MQTNGHTYQTIRLTPELQKYKQHLLNYFSQASDYDDFSTLIERELSEFGIVHWAYTELDLPDRLTAEEHLGTIDKTFSDIYLEDSLYENDLVLQHIKSSDAPVFQSDIKEQLENLSFSSEFFHGFDKIIQRRKEFGYSDSCSIPVTSAINGSRFVLCLNLKSLKQVDFKNRVSKSMAHLKILAIAVNEVGANLFPELFLSPGKRYKAVAYSKPLELLTAIFKLDLSIKGASEHLGISIHTADNHIKKLKKYFNVKTIHGAYEIARLRGLIE